MGEGLEISPRVQAKGFKPEQINGTEDKEIIVKFSSGERKFNGQTFLLNFLFAKFLFSRHHRLRHPAPLRYRARQARFHGNAGNTLGECAPLDERHLP